MLAKRIIPCLDVMNGITVKGVNFTGLREAGNPVELGKRYSDEGADELVYLDISASSEGRKTFLGLVREVAKTLSIPFTVGGGIGSVDDVDKLLANGADKVSINSAALNHPELIEDIANRFGSQVCVVAIDAKRDESGMWMCYEKGGRFKTNKSLFDWAKEAEDRGAGEILFTSMEHDGVKNGYACNELRKLHEILHIPVIASGGCGCAEHFVEVFDSGKADAALAASVFHFGEINIIELKQFLHQRGINVRL